MGFIKNKQHKAALAEFAAMTLFVWIGCGSAVATQHAGIGDVLAIATAFGFAISLLAYSIGHISGGHINPAVSFALFLIDEIDVTTLALYAVAQFTGAIFGALLLWGSVASITYGCTPDSVEAVCMRSIASDGESFGPAFGLGVNALGPGVQVGSGFLIELMGTYLLLFTVLMTAVHKKSTAGNTAPIAIGWSVMMAHIVMIPFTGCGINPARSFGPMVVNSFGGLNTWTYGTWIFYVAPFIGAGLAAVTYKALFEEDEEEEEEKKEGVAEDDEVPVEKAKEAENA